jgi:hypothetical protein
MRNAFKTAVRKHEWMQSQDLDRDGRVVLRWIVRRWWVEDMDWVHVAHNKGSNSLTTVFHGASLTL